MVRLLEAMDRAGAVPWLLKTHASREDVGESMSEVASRGWTIEFFDPPTQTLADRVRQQVRRDGLRAPGLAARLESLANHCAFVQLEEIDAAQYLPCTGGARTIVSFYNIDSNLFRTFAPAEGLTRRRASYRAHRVAALEQRAARNADLTLCVSEDDCAYFTQHGAEALLIPNGVDNELFSLPARAAETDDVLFFGTFEWPPNREGLLRFVREGWQQVLREHPTARLRIVGPAATTSIGGVLDGYQGVEVVGFVEDLVEELASARVVIVPIWLGGGTRLKVLEALGAARPVVGTALGVEQIGFEHERHGLVANTPNELAAATIRVLRDDGLAERLAKGGRDLASRYGWESVTVPLESIYRSWLAA